jgi:hypothetical protein
MAMLTVCSEARFIPLLPFPDTRTCCVGQRSVADLAKLLNTFE